MFDFKFRIDEILPENDVSKEIRAALEFANEKKTEAQRAYAAFEENYINDLRNIREAYGEDVYRDVTKVFDEKEEEATRLISKIDKTITDLEELQEQVGNTNMEEIIERYNAIGKRFEEIAISMQEKQNEFDSEEVAETYEGY